MVEFAVNIKYDEQNNQVCVVPLISHVFIDIIYGNIYSYKSVCLYIVFEYIHIQVNICTHVYVCLLYIYVCVHIYVNIIDIEIDIDRFIDDREREKERKTDDR